MIEIPALWIRIARNYLDWGNSFYKNEDVQLATNTYINVISPDDKTPVNSPLYNNHLNVYGKLVSMLITDIKNPDISTLNPETINIVLDVRNRLKKINIGMDYIGYQDDDLPVFKFDTLQNMACYFARQAVQAERVYTGFTTSVENGWMTREQIQQTIELCRTQVELELKLVEEIHAELEINKENAVTTDHRLRTTQQQKEQYVNLSYERTALKAASIFTGGPEGHEVAFTYYSPAERRDVTLSGINAHRVLRDVIWKRGMLSRDTVLANIERTITE